MYRYSYTLLVRGQAYNYTVEHDMLNYSELREERGHNKLRQKERERERA